MNNRIQKLLSQAGVHYEVMPKDTVYEKFAEALIREAISVVNKRYMGDNNREDMEVRRCVEDLKKHFGVK
jgi:uncharacterized protein YqgV (UPF0045/DUF77 family)